MSACSGSVVQTTPTTVAVEQPATLVADSTLASPTPEPTQVSTPTSVPTDTPVPPTATPALSTSTKAPPTPTEISPTPTEEIPTPDATPTPEVPSVVSNKDLNVRSGPSTSFDPPVSSLSAGTTAEVNGKATVGGQLWYRLKDGSGWIAGWLVEGHLLDQVETVPVEDIPNTPTPEPTATQSPSTETPEAGETQPSAPEVSGNYYWGGMTPGNKIDGVGPINLAKRGNSHGRGSWPIGISGRIVSKSFTTEVREIKDGGGFRSEFQKFIMGNMVGEPTFTNDEWGGSAELKIKNLNGLIERVSIRRRAYGGIVVWTKNNQGQNVSFQTNIQTIDPGLLRDGDSVGISVNSETEEPDNNRLWIVD